MRRHSFCHTNTMQTRNSCVWSCPTLFNILTRSLMEYQETIPMLRSPSNAPINVTPAWGGGGGQGMGGGFDCLCWPWGRTFEWSSSPRGGFESFFARHGDIWLPTRTKKTETEHMFPTSTLRACAVRSGKIWKSWRPTRTSESWVDFTVLSSNFVRFSVFLINWTS